MNTPSRVPPRRASTRAPEHSHPLPCDESMLGDDLHVDRIRGVAALCTTPPGSFWEEGKPFSLSHCC